MLVRIMHRCRLFTQHCNSIRKIRQISKISYSGYGMSVGQNMAWGYGSWDAAIQAWFNEVKDFEFGTGSKNGNAVGHYTQVLILNS